MQEMPTERLRRGIRKELSCPLVPFPSPRRLLPTQPVLSCSPPACGDGAGGMLCLSLQKRQEGAALHPQTQLSKWVSVTGNNWAYVGKCSSANNLLAQWLLHQHRPW